MTEDDSRHDRSGPKRLPKPITPTRGGGRAPAVLPVKFGAADWETWSQRITAELWQAVVLSLGFEPKALTHSDYDSLDGPFGDFPEKFKRRLSVAIDHSEAGVLPSDRTTPNEPFRKVKLAEFVVWATQLGWDLPREMPDFGGRPGQDHPTSADTASRFPSDTAADAHGGIMSEKRIVVWPLPPSQPTIKVDDAAKLLVSGLPRPPMAKETDSAIRTDILASSQEVRLKQKMLSAGGSGQIDLIDPIMGLVAREGIFGGPTGDWHISPEQLAAFAAGLGVEIRMPDEFETSRPAVSPAAQADVQAKASPSEGTSAANPVSPTVPVTAPETKPAGVSDEDWRAYRDACTFQGRGFWEKRGGVTGAARAVGKHWGLAGNDADAIRRRLYRVLKALRQS